MANLVYTVVAGDTLSEIAKKYNTSVAVLLTNNPSIKDPDYIVIGQEIVITGVATALNSSQSRAVVEVFGLVSNTDRSMYAAWTWNTSNTEKYKYIWYYDMGISTDDGDTVWFIGNEGETTNKQSTYDAPANAKAVKFIVKPLSRTTTKNAYLWTASWSKNKVYYFSNNPPSVPPVPTVTVDKYKLTAKLENLNLNGTHIQFQIVKNDSSVFNTGNAKIVTSAASYSCTVNAGDQYKVRCRAYRGSSYSEWSEYSSNVSTMPSVPSKITTIKASSETSVYLAWSKVSSANTYDIEFATKKEYLGASDASNTVTGIDTTNYEKTGLESGQEYFFRVRAVNNNGASAWSGVKSVVIGKTPAAPTTWSSSTTAITGDQVVLYWVHNSEDGSSQTFAELEMYIGSDYYCETIKNSTDEDEKDKTSSYTIDTSEYIEGTVIQWRVRTAGVTKTYGDWSVERTIDIHAPSTLELSMTDANGENIEVLESFPFYIYGLAGPNTQQPTGYHLSIISNEVYETVDRLGNPVTINAGEEIYSKYFDTPNTLLVELSAGNLDLENNISYTVSCTVSMNTGLTATSSLRFTVSWSDDVYEPNAEITINKDTYSVSIRPYCVDTFENVIPDVTLAVYRREFDGRFTELATGIVNGSNTYITDPHPALDFARYRIVATTVATGMVSYFDITGLEVGCTSVILQWNEEWTNFDTHGEEELAQPAWSGSMLKLPYNIDVSNNHRPDMVLVEYIGRDHPVSYYGTQVGETATWNMVIERDDKETLYALRRLSKWMGDVYVREPSGSGYWANVTVTFSQKHMDLTIPVTLEIARVEGGI